MGEMPEGQNQDPAPAGAEAGFTEDQGDEGESDWKGRFEDLNARYDLLNDTVAELRDAVLSRGNSGGQSHPEVDDLDDDEPLTGSKVKKIVSSSINQAVARNNQVSQRETWDNKAKADFPLGDPKFMREFKREWGSMTADGGLDPNHPKAVYTVARTVARGWKSQTKSANTTHETSEPPSRASSDVTRPGSRKNAKVDDSDPRVKFYAMRGNKTKDQIEKFKTRISEQDAKAERRGRR